jgi:general secretion pathway protein G
MRDSSSRSEALTGLPGTLRSVRGFTLIEMLIVILIIGLVAGLVGPALFGKLTQSQETAAKTQMKAFSQALDMYRLDVGRYPDNLDALVHSSGQNWDGPYLRDVKDVPKDPWDHDYQYSVTDGGKNYTLSSQGSGNGTISYK